MIFYMFWLIFCDTEGIGGIFITMNDSSLIFDIQNNFSKQFFCNLQQAFELFGNGSLVFQNSLNPGASGGLRHPGYLTKAFPWTHWGPCSPRSPESFSGFQLWATFTPVNPICDVYYSWLNMNLISTFISLRPQFLLYFSHCRLSRDQLLTGSS